MLAGFYALIECKEWKRWAFPLVVIGTNSIAIYVMSWTMEDFLPQSSGDDLGNVISDGWSASSLLPMAYGIGVMLILSGLMLAWMYRRKIFIKI